MSPTLFVIAAIAIAFACTFLLCEWIVARRVPPPDDDPSAAG
ncbi:MAG: hypothetical protein ACR2FJ_09380 [Qipengyuania sp.]